MRSRPPAAGSLRGPERSSIGLRPATPGAAPPPAAPAGCRAACAARAWPMSQMPFPTRTAPTHNSIAASSMGTSSLRSVAGRADTACSRLAAARHRPLPPAPPTDRLWARRRPERREERGGAVPFGAARTTAAPRPSGEWEASSSPPSTGFSGPPSTGVFGPAGCSGRDGLELVLVEAASPSRCPVQAAPVRPPHGPAGWKEGAWCTPCSRRGRLLREPQASSSADSW